MNDFLTAIEPTLITLFTAILTALGVIITKFVTDHFGAKTAMLESQGYQMASEYAAGWLKTYLDTLAGSTAALASTTAVPVPATPLTINAPVVQDAVKYMKQSFPDAIHKIETSTGSKLGDHELAADILGAFGKIAPGPLGLGAGLLAGILKKE